ncbi:MAG: 30S ribosomal protein S1 [Acidobacteriota bacterium]|nr:30S ribosomal protein S1 [Acidobacteriota bacterium]
MSSTPEETDGDGIQSPCLRVMVHVEAEVSVMETPNDSELKPTEIVEAAEAPAAEPENPEGAHGIHVEEIDDFAAVLAEFEAGAKAVKEGDVVIGTVLRVLEKEVVVDVGYKSEGVIDLDEFRQVDGSIKVDIGDKVDVLLEKTENNDGYVVLSKEKAEKLKVWDAVEKAYEKDEPVDGRVIDRIKGGLKVDIGLPAFLPGSLVDVRPVRNLESMIGNTYPMKVIKVNKRRGNIVLSRKAVLEVENASKKKKTLEDLEEGKILRGVVKNLTEYGAFIDLGGIDGLLHITDISWGRINHPSEKFQIGDELDVIVLKFDREKERVSLGFKQLQEDPWENAPMNYPPRSRIRGKVVSLTDYGAFVEVEEGIEGLIHVSEMSWTKRVKHPSKVLNISDWVECVVLEIDQEGRRLSLGLKQTEPNPWDLIGSKYRIGDRITGTVRNITDFGAFIEVEDGIDGLVHISDLSWTTRVKHPSEVLNKGDSVDAVVLKIDSENQRLSLGVKQTQPNVLDEFFQHHGIGSILRGKVTRLAEFGAFVEVFEGVEGLVHVSELSTERVENPEDSFSVGQEVRVKVIKLDPVEKKIGLSVKAAVGEPETESVQAYFEAQPSDGSATLGDLMDPTLFAKSGETAETPAETTDDAADETPSDDGDDGDDDDKKTKTPAEGDA